MKEKEQKKFLLEEQKKYDKNLLKYNQLKLNYFNISRVSIVLALILFIIFIYNNLINMALYSVFILLFSSTINIILSLVYDNKANKNMICLKEINKNLEEILNNEYISKKEELEKNKELSNEEKLKILKEYKSIIIKYKLDNLNNNIGAEYKKSIKKKVYKPNNK